MTETDSQTQYCYVHPNRATVLRCNRCERPICTSCAVLTPTGYRCKECVRGQQKIFDTARWWDYPAAILVAFGLSMVGSLLVSRFSGIFGFFTIFIAPIAGMIITEAVRFVVHKRRSKNLTWAASGAAFIGGIINSVVVLISIFSITGLMMLFSFIWPIVFAVLVTSTVYYRLAGIRL